MPKGKTRSSLSLRERREQAFRMYEQGYTPTEVAKELRVSRATAHTYKKKYEESIEEEARLHPGLMRDVLANTIRSLRELDRIRADAWKRLNEKRVHKYVECPDCGSDFDVVVREPASDQSRVQYHNVLIRAQEQRAKLFGVLGVKQEVFVMITQVKLVQDRILNFLQNNLCPHDRENLERFLLSDPEIVAYMASPGYIDAEVVGEIAAESEFGSE